jgi:glycosyltransferase involved in cell wall biosynthesis
VSLYEGFGLPIIEANSIGRPVITSDIEPMKSIGNDSVILVNPNNASEITLAINSIAGNKDLRNDLISKGLENAEKFRALSIAKEYERLYYKY